jgi:hypothetical protein
VRDAVADLFARHAEGLQGRGQVGAESMDEVNRTLRRVERYWTEQIRYIY